MKEFGFAVVFVSVLMFQSLWAAETVSFSGERYDREVTILLLKGTWREMGCQYGSLMKKEFRAIYEFAETDFRRSDVPGDWNEFLKTARQQSDILPERFRQMQEGLAEGCGLNLDQLAVLEYMRVSGLNNSEVASCSTLAVWGDFTTDGQLMMGRNFDFPTVYFKANPFLVLVIFQPTDGSVPTATLGYVGEIGAFDTFNATGLVGEINHALTMPKINKGPIHDRISPTIVTDMWSFDCRTMTQVDAAVKTYRYNYALFYTVADRQSCRTYEIGTRDAKLREPDEPGMNAVSNYVDPTLWPDAAAVPPDDRRRENLNALARKYKGRIDFATMKKIMDVEMEHGGARDAGRGHDFMTLYQFIYVPASKRLSLCRPYAKDGKWIDIDLQHFFEARPSKD